MGSLLLSQRILGDCADNTLQFLNHEDALALAESVLAPKPYPKAKVIRTSPMRYPILMNDELTLSSLR